MNKHIQIRNVPDALHSRLKQRAAQQGLSLSDYLRAEMERLAMLPTINEWVAKVRTRPSAGISAEDIVRSVLDARENRTDDILRTLGTK